MYFMHRQKRATVVLAAILASSVFVGACVPSASRQGLTPVATLLTERGAAASSLLLADSVLGPRAIPAGPLVSDTAVRIALLRSPHVRVVLADVGLAAADLWQASRIPNPVVDLLRGFQSGGGVGITNVGIGFSIVAALQTPMRRRIAQTALHSAEQRVANAVYDAMIDVQRAYVDVQYAQQNLELQQSVAVGTAASTTVAQALRAAGNVSELALASEEAVSTQSVADVSAAESALLIARAELGRRLGAGVGDTLWTIGERLADPTVDRLVIAHIDSLTIARRLDVAAARDRAQSAAAALGLSARFRFLQDGTLGAFWERDPDGRFVGPSASIPLPLFNGGGAGVAKARASLQQRTAEYDALVVDAHAEVRAAIARVDGARRRAVQIRTAVLPTRRRVLQESQLQVNAMALPVFALLQAKQAEIEAGRMYLDALRDYWVARAELERASGGSLPAGRAP